MDNHRHSTKRPRPRLNIIRVACRVADYYDSRSRLQDITAAAADQSGRQTIMVIWLVDDFTHRTIKADPAPVGCCVGKQEDSIN